jgi:virginiamycin A acetyltransferase
LLTFLAYYIKNRLELISKIHTIKHLKKKKILEIGKYSYGIPHIYFWDYETKLIIGKFCSISSTANFLLGGNHRKEWISTFPFNAFSDFSVNVQHEIGYTSTKGDIIVGNDVWIGHGAIIMSGVEIGDGAIIGAGSLISKNIEAYAIYVGNPAQKIGYRFDSEVIEKLIKIRWWDNSKIKINRMIEHLSKSPSESLDKLLSLDKELDA